CLQARRYGRRGRRTQRVDRDRGLVLICALSEEGPAGHAFRRAEGREAIFRRRSEHDGVVCAGGVQDGEGLVMRISLLAALLAMSSSAAANMAEQAHRSKVDGIDLITYRSNVKDVVVIIGVLPAGDAMAEAGNIAIPTLSGMMLDRGTKAMDKFAISEKLDNVGAEISFQGGVQSLEVRAKC